MIDLDLAEDVAVNLRLRDSQSAAMAARTSSVPARLRVMETVGDFIRGYFP